MKTNLVNLLKSTNGKFFRVSFIKKNGELRHMTCRLKVTKHLKGVGMSYDPRDYNLMTVWDTTKRSYRMVNLSTLINFRCGKLKWAA